MHQVCARVRSIARCDANWHRRRPGDAPPNAARIPSESSEDGRAPACAGAPQDDQRPGVPTISSNFAGTSFTCALESTQSTTLCSTAIPSKSARRSGFS